jgi:hypothetical protein
LREERGRLRQRWCAAGWRGPILGRVDRVPGWWQEDLRGQNILRLEPEVELLELEKTANHQPCARQQDQRQSNLRNDEERAPSMSPEPALFGCVDQARPGNLERRRDSEPHAGQRCQRGHEQQDGRIDLHLVHSREVGRADANE